MEPMTSRMRKIAKFEGLRTIDKPEQPQMRTGNCPKCGEDWRTHDYACKEPEQPITSKEEAEKVAQEYFKTTKQPNKELLIVKKIQSLMSEASERLDELDKNIQFLSCAKPLLVRQAHKDISQLIEAVDMFEKTTLYELQRQFE